MPKTVVALLDNPSEAHRAVNELLRSGFDKKHVGVMTKDDVPAEFKAVMKDMGKGAAIGGLTGLLLAATTLIVPGFGPLLVAGPAAALTAGLAYGGLAGGIIGALMSKGVPEEHAHAYAEGVRRGGALVTAHAQDDEHVGRAVETMRAHGAAKLDDRIAQWRREGWSGRFDAQGAGEPAPGATLPAGLLLSAVEVYDMVIELPERRRGTRPYSGQERRKAA